MDSLDMKLAQATNRRRFLAEAAIGSGALIAAPALAQSMVDLHLPGGPSERPMTNAFPGKGSMILQRIHPPLLETPMSVFNGDVFTPNDQFFVRWHWADIPTAIDVEAFRLKVHGQVNATAVDLARATAAAAARRDGGGQPMLGQFAGLFQPPVAGAQWGNGAMGNAKWLGVRLRDVLDYRRREARRGRRCASARSTSRSLRAHRISPSRSTIDHARDGEVMIAFGMNGEQLPLLNGFPFRLIVPGWYSTYWVKMLNDIEVLAAPDDEYWMAKAYKIPATPARTCGLARRISRPSRSTR